MAPFLAIVLSADGSSGNPNIELKLIDLPLWKNNNCARWVLFQIRFSAIENASEVVSLPVPLN